MCAALEARAVKGFVYYPGWLLNGDEIFEIKGGWVGQDVQAFVRNLGGPRSCIAAAPQYLTSQQHSGTRSMHAFHIYAHGRIIHTIIFTCMCPG